MQVKLIQQKGSKKNLKSKEQANNHQRRMKKKKKSKQTQTTKTITRRERNSIFELKADARSTVVPRKTTFTKNLRNKGYYHRDFWQRCKVAKSQFIIFTNDSDHVPPFSLRRCHIPFSVRGVTDVYLRGRSIRHGNIFKGMVHSLGRRDAIDYIH